MLSEIRPPSSTRTKQIAAKIIGAKQMRRGKINRRADEIKIGILAGKGKGIGAKETGQHHRQQDHHRNHRQTVRGKAADLQLKGGK
ncbi:MAG: hypothetical protein V9G14_04055 [Cypionkella sp.]